MAVRNWQIFELGVLAGFARHETRLPHQNVRISSIW